MTAPAVRGILSPGHLADMAAGKMGFLSVSQGSLFASSLLMALPSLMIPVSLLATARLNRPANLVVGALYILVSLGNLAGETWAFYWLFGLLELGLLLLIVVTALRWPRQAD